jgi:hypothetical protein
MKRSAKEEADSVKITPLGAGNEVGRSCILLEYKEKKILVSKLDNKVYFIIICYINKRRIFQKKKKTCSLLLSLL